MILEVLDLRKTYILQGGFGAKKSVQALRGVSFHLKRGETLAIVGESGCGKSTLAKLLLKIEPTTGGSVRIDGKPIESISSLDLSSFVQMVFQDPYSSLNPRKKIFDIIAEPLVVKGLAQDEIKNSVLKSIEEVGLRPEMADRYPHMLSGGQRQRVGIARALITKPQIIICDEPVSALDVSVQGQVLNLLLDLQKNFGLSYLFISHDLGVVRFIADRVAVMYLGQIVELGSSEEIFSDPKHPYTKLLLSSAPHFDLDEITKESDPNAIMNIDGAVISGEIPSPLNPPKGCGFSSRCIYKIDQCQKFSPGLEVKGGRAVACLRISPEGQLKEDTTTKG